MIHPLQPFRDSKHLHIHQSVDSHVNEELYMVAELRVTCGMHWQT